MEITATFTIPGRVMMSEEDAKKANAYTTRKMVFWNPKKHKNEVRIIKERKSYDAHQTIHCNIEGDPNAFCEKLAWDLHATDWDWESLSKKKK